MRVRDDSQRPDAALGNFARLVEPHSAALFRYLLRMVGDRALAEDLLQDTFAAAYAHRNGLQDPGSTKAWLFTIARNRAHNALRHGSRMIAGGPNVVEQLRNLPASSPNPEAEVLRLELRAEILAALQQLPPARREAVVLRDIEGLSYADIAAITDSTEGAARVQVHRARQQLQGLLIPYLQDEPAPPDIGSGPEGET